MNFDYLNCGCNILQERINSGQRNWNTFVKIVVSSLVQFSQTDFSSFVASFSIWTCNIYCTHGSLFFRRKNYKIWNIQFHDYQNILIIKNESTNLLLNTIKLTFFSFGSQDFINKRKFNRNNEILINAKKAYNLFFQSKLHWLISKKNENSLSI